MERRLLEYGRVEGLTIGTHGEGSKEFLKLINRMTERVVTRHHHVLGYESAGGQGLWSSQTTSLCTWQSNNIALYMVLGIDAVRGAARLTLTNLGIILADQSFTSAAATRRRNAHLKYQEVVDFYWTVHFHFENYSL